MTDNRITISVCTIVKNEGNVLKRCLDSLAGIYDELILVDTGSTDNTREIAKKYTDKIYDFTWTGSFSDARNFAFSKATGDYIYSADADEIIDEENRQKFLYLKQALLPEIEIVEMHYTGQLTYNTTYNYNDELRPKLYKRLREFTWIDPVHEAVRLDPVVYESDIKIIHAPTGNHSKRDFGAYLNAIEKDGQLSDHLKDMYARELFISGDREDFKKAEPYFKEMSENETDEDRLVKVLLVLIRNSRLEANAPEFIKYSSRLFALISDNKPTLEIPSELCFEMGEYFLNNGDKEEAKMWYINASEETESVLALNCHDTLPKERLSYLNL